LEKVVVELAVLVALEAVVVLADHQVEALQTLMAALVVYMVVVVALLKEELVELAVVELFASFGLAIKENSQAHSQEICKEKSWQ
jgi:hypothetical protein